MQRRKFFQNTSLFVGSVLIANFMHSGYKNLLESVQARQLKIAKNKPHEKAFEKGKYTVWKLTDKPGFFFQAGMAIDADGAPNAYHPQNKGIDGLEHAGEPGNWWALVTDTGKPTGNPVIQKANDPYPGYYISSTVMPEWLHLANADGTISQDDVIKQKRALDYIHEHRPDLRIMPLINNFDDGIQSWDGKKLSETLDNPSARQNLVKNLLSFVRTNKFAGVSIDFETVAASSQGNLLTFMRELYNVFHPLGLEVSQSVPFADSSFNYRALAEYNDYLILMAYDQHEASTEPGPVASQKWYVDNLRTRFAELPANTGMTGKQIQLMV
jgi:Glycosyl hydrolases family 18